ncbi:MAG: hypothetical protein NC541_14860 [bacterium]|nr:hypothetical protein [bacterium]
MHTVKEGIKRKSVAASALCLTLFLTGCQSGQTGNAVLEEPPVLTVTCGETVFDAPQGSYSWQKQNGDGSVTAAEACGVAPLECKGVLSRYETDETTAVLRFAEEPDAVIRVLCWSVEHCEDPYADGEEAAVSGYEIELKPGEYIYEVAAEWDFKKRGYGGTVYYLFYVEVSDQEKLVSAE